MLIEYHTQYSRGVSVSPFRKYNKRVMKFAYRSPVSLRPPRIEIYDALYLLACSYRDATKPADRTPQKKLKNTGKP